MTYQNLTALYDSTIENGQAPSDLTWKLHKFNSPERAIHLMRWLKNYFAVYSSSVEMIYTRYQCLSTGYASHKSLLLLPNFSEWDSIYANIPHEAIEPTAFKIFPGEQMGRRGLYLLGPVDGRPRPMAYPLKAGLGKLLCGGFSGGLFLPILKQGTLRELPQRDLPVLYLYKVNLKKLVGLSRFEKENIKRTLLRNLLELRRSAELAKPELHP